MISIFFQNNFLATKRRIHENYQECEKLKRIKY